MRGDTRSLDCGSYRDKQQTNGDLVYMGEPASLWKSPVASWFGALGSLECDGHSFTPCSKFFEHIGHAA